MHSYHRRAEGQGLVEYALLLVLVAVVVIGILVLLGPTISGVFATIIATLNGQPLNGAGTEYVITGLDASAAGSFPFCTVTVSGMEVTVFVNGQLAGAGVNVSGSVTFDGGAGGATSGATDNGGTATHTPVSGGGNCSGTATLSIAGGGSKTVSYSN